MIILASGCDAPYYSNMLAYMQSVRRHNTLAKTYLVGVGWQPPSELGFTGVYLPIDKAAGHGGTSWCVQHGAFLHAIPAQEDDVVVFTDGGDVVMQRDFSEAELRSLHGLPHGTVMVGPDIGLNLEQDANLLRPAAHHHLPIPECNHSGSVYNTGVVACTAKTYRELYVRYMAQFLNVYEFFNHFGRQQWLISRILGEDSYFTVEHMPQSFHTHGHISKLPATLPPGCRLEGGVLYHDDEVVLFKHRIPHPLMVL